MKPVLELRNLSVSFGDLGQPVRGLSLDLYPGQIAAVVGASGSGKSLLAHALLDLLPMDATVEGELIFSGVIGRDIVLVPQGAGYLDPLTRVGRQLALGRHSPQRVATVLAEYGLGPEVMDLYPFELSGGMARRVLIAAAVLENPKVVVADEPTPGLDHATARRVMGHFRALADGGAAVLVITHDLALAADTADSVTVLRDGAVAASFPAGEFATVAHPYVRQLWNAMPEHGFGEGFLT